MNTLRSAGTLASATAFAVLSGVAAWGGEGGRPAAPIQLKLPFPAGETYRVIQGNHGKFSHHNASNRYAWDFDMAIGTPVAAAGAGRVVDIKQDSTKGGKYLKFADDGNYVEIDHGNGLFSQYLHLAFRSVRVRVGDIVQSGEVIARSGNNGFSSRPHLHFMVADYLGRSHPALFTDFPRHGGVPREREDCTSRQVTAGARRFPGDSWLPRDAFAKNGIRLASELPGRLWRPRQEYRLTGRLDGQGRRVAVFVMPHDGGKPLREYFGDLDSRGRFDFSFTLFVPEKRWEKNPHVFSLAIARVRPNGSYFSSFGVPITIYRDQP